MRKFFIFLFSLCLFSTLTLYTAYAGDYVSFSHMQADGGAIFSCGGYHSLEEIIVYGYSKERYKVERLQAPIGKWVIVEARNSKEAATIGCKRYFNYSNPFAGIHLEKD